MKKLLLSALLMLGFTYMANAQMDMIERLIDCENGKTETAGESCNILGSIYDYGIDTDKNPKVALVFYVKGCEFNNYESCKNAGFMYSEGQGAEKDRQRGLKLFEKACDGNDYDACYNLGVAYKFGDGKKKDIAKAIKLYKKACKGGQNGGCYNLGYAYMKGEGVKQDTHEANNFFDKSCDLKMGRGCFNVAVGYIKGDTRVENFEIGKKFLKLACDYGYEQGCKVLGDLDPNFVRSNTSDLSIPLDKAFEEKLSCTITDNGKNDISNTMTTKISKRVKDKSKPDTYKQTQHIIVHNSKKKTILDRETIINTNINHKVISITEINHLDKKENTFFPVKLKDQDEISYKKVDLNEFKAITNKFRSQTNGDIMYLKAFATQGMLLITKSIFVKGAKKPNYMVVRLPSFNKDKTALLMNNIEVYLNFSGLKYSNMQE
jgi:TPR repeat protein